MPRPRDALKQARPRRGYLQVTCWCERWTYPVPEADVRKGKTRSCGGPGCGPPEDGEPRAAR